MLNRSLVKECPWAEHLTSLPRKGVGAFLSVSAFSNSLQITQQAITYNGTTSNFEIES